MQLCITLKALNILAHKGVTVIKKQYERKCIQCYRKKIVTLRNETVQERIILIQFYLQMT